MTRVLFVLFGLSCVFFSCKGDITSPPDRTEYIFLPGQTAKIKWEFDDTISSLKDRSWSFTSKDGSLEESIASISKNESTVIESTLFEVDIERPATLVLKSVNQSYTGTYQFALKIIKTVTSDVMVSIAMKPNATTNCSSPITVNKGDNFTCVCSGEGGNPPANVTWFKNGTKFGETRKENNTLTRTNVDETDNITYTCLAQSYPDPKFEDWEPVVVQVEFKPKDTTIEFTQNPAELGTSVTIKCKSRGFPEPSYTITLNGTKTVSNEKTHTIPIVGWNDTGTYNCTATNERGSDWAADVLNVTEQGPTTKPPPSSTPTSTTEKSSNGTVTTPDDGEGKGGLSTGAIIGIIIGVLLLLVIIGIVVYCCKSKEKDGRNRGNIDPVPGNHYELENEEPVPGDGAYDSVGPVGASGSKSKPPAGNTLPPVYAAVDKNNRQGNTLYASLDTEALQTSRASKKEPDRPPQAEYASIDFGKTAPKADLV